VNESQSDRATVYLETTIVSYLTARPSQNIIYAAQQELTRQWWDKDREHYRLFISPYVLEEAAAGDSTAAEQRLQVLKNLELLPLVPEIENLAQRIVVVLGLPERSRMDGYHLACAIEYEMDILLTWNCSHLANSHHLRLLTNFLRAEDRWMPIVCTPDFLTQPSEGFEDD
jgi:hypothetical protein